MVVVIGGRAHRCRSLFARIAVFVVVGLSSSQAISWATPGRLEQARGRALNYFATQVRTPDPGWLSLFGYLHRRFGLEARLASGALPHQLKDGVGRPEVFAIYRRIDDPSAAITKQQIADLPTPIDRITATALHCDRIPVPDDWIEILRKGSAAGAYALTHSVVATEWTVENGCRARADVAALQQEQITLLVRFIEQRHELAGRFDAITDMWIEAVDMLYYIGARESVQSAWIDEILALQRDDGGWPRHPRAPRSDPHATALAIWVLLENLQPNAARIPWIRQP
jgi:hypothetical protein